MFTLPGGPAGERLPPGSVCGAGRLRRAGAGGGRAQAGRRGGGDAAPDGRVKGEHREARRGAEEAGRKGERHSNQDLFG